MIFFSKFICTSGRPFSSGGRVETKNQTLFIFPLMRQEAINSLLFESTRRLMHKNYSPSIPRQLDFEDEDEAAPASVIEAAARQVSVGA